MNKLILICIIYTLDRINENKIIIISDKILNIISLLEKKKMNKIDDKYIYNGIKLIKNKGIS